MVEKANIFVNTSDWPHEVMPEAELLFGLDGDASDLSGEDLLLAGPLFCDSQDSGGALKQIVCSYDQTTAGLWRATDEINKLRSKFSQDNRLHEHARMEGRILPAETIREGYEILEEILIRVKDELGLNHGLSSQEKVILVYRVMRELDFTFHGQENSLFFENLAMKSVDCDSSSFIVMAVAHEFKWPLHLVYAPGHVFVRWQGKEEAFNMDYGNIFPDGYYMMKYSISMERLIAGTDYLAIVHGNLGYVLADLGRNEEAEVEYREAIRLDPKDADVYYNLGFVLADLGRNKEAEVELREAIRLDPKAAYAYVRLGIVLAMLGRYKKAETELREAIRLDPKDAYAHVGLGVVLEKLGRNKEAEAEYREAIGFDPKYAGAYYNLSLLYYYKLDKLDEGVRCAEEALKLDPNNVLFKEWRDKIGRQ